MWKSQIQAKLWPASQQAQILLIFVFNAIKKYIIEYHPSIKKIKHFKGGKDLKFPFVFDAKNKILAEIHNLDKKACQKSDIPVKIIEDNIGIFF